MIDTSFFEALALLLQSRYTTAHVKVTKPANATCAFHLDVHLNQHNLYLVKAPDSKWQYSWYHSGDDVGYGDGPDFVFDELPLALIVDRLDSVDVPKVSF